MDVPVKIRKRRTKSGVQYTIKVPVIFPCIKRLHGLFSFIENVHVDFQEGTTIRTCTLPEEGSERVLKEIYNILSTTKQLFNLDGSKFEGKIIYSPTSDKKKVEVHALQDILEH